MRLETAHKLVDIAVTLRRMTPARRAEWHARLDQMAGIKTQDEAEAKNETELSHAA